MRRLRAAAIRLGRVHLWGAPRRHRPPLAGEEAVWARIAAERAGANMHVALGGYVALFLGLAAAVFASIAITDPGSLLSEILRHGPKIAVVIAVWLLPVLLWPLAGQLERRTLAQRTADEARTQWRTMRWLAGCGLAVLALAFTLLVVDQPPLLLLGGLVASGMVIGAGLSWRTGRELVCRRCAYPADPEPQRWTRCSECGAELTAPLAVVRGHTVRRLWLSMLGLGAWSGCVWALAEMLIP